MNEKLIGQRIAEVRESRGMSQSELARRLGVKPQAVQKWEAGGAPRTHRIAAIAQTLGMSPKDLVGDETASVLPTEQTDWPFKRVSRGHFDALPLRVRIEIEDYMEMRVRNNLAESIPAPAKSANG